MSLTYEFKGPTTPDDAFEFCRENPENFRKIPSELIDLRLAKHLLSFQASWISELPQALIDGSQELVNDLLASSWDNYRFIPYACRTVNMLLTFLDKLDQAAPHYYAAYMTEDIFRLPGLKTPDLYKLVDIDPNIIYYAPKKLVDRDVLKYALKKDSLTKSRALRYFFEDRFLDDELIELWLKNDAGLINYIPAKFITHQLATKMIDEGCPLDQIPLEFWTLDYAHEAYSELEADFFAREQFDYLRNKFNDDKLTAIMIRNSPSLIKKIAASLTIGVLRHLKDTSDVTLINQVFMNKPELILNLLRENPENFRSYGMFPSILFDELDQDSCRDALDLISENNSVMTVLLGKILNDPSYNARYLTRLVNLHPEVFELLQEKWRTPEINKIALTHDGLYLKLLNLKEVTSDLALVAVRQNPMAIEYIYDRRVFDEIMVRLDQNIAPCDDDFTP